MKSMRQLSWWFETAQKRGKMRPYDVRKPHVITTSLACQQDDDGLLEASSPVGQG